MSKKRRGGYLATAEGVKKLKEAKRVKKYTYQQIAEAAKETEDKVKRLFNPQWGDGKYKVGEEAVQGICNVLDLKPEEIVSDWYPMDFLQKSGEGEKGEKDKPERSQENTFARDPIKIGSEKDEVVTRDRVKEHDPSYYKALEKIEQAVKDGREELDLSGMGLTELPASIVQLTNLTVLFLDNNSLSSLPAAIGQLTNLTHLSLDNNSLSSLPAAIGKLTNLTVLFLDNNSLSSLPAAIGQLTNLTELSLNKNSLSSLPAAIGQLTNLTVLFLDNNSLSSLPAAIGQLTNLTELSLNKNSLSSLPAAIGQLTNLTYLYLTGNSLSSLPAAIGQLISNH